MRHRHYEIHSSSPPFFRIVLAALLTVLAILYVVLTIAFWATDPHHYTLVEVLRSQYEFLMALSNRVW
jgi:hypothetical protein